MLDVGGVPKVTGGTFPARIWQAFMGPVHAGVPVEDFPPPPPSPDHAGYLRMPDGSETPRPATTTTTEPDQPPERSTTSTTTPRPKGGPPRKTGR
jgi:penicillin-binding protein 1A